MSTWFGSYLVFMTHVLVKGALFNWWIKCGRQEPPSLAGKPNETKKRNNLNALYVLLAFLQSEFLMTGVAAEIQIN